MTAFMAALWRRRPADGWLDVALAAVLLVACEVEVITDTIGDHGHDHWPLAANIAVVAGLTVPLAWRRRKPAFRCGAILPRKSNGCSRATAERQKTRCSKQSAVSSGSWSRRSRRMWPTRWQSPFVIITCGAISLGHFRRDYKDIRQSAAA